MQSSRHTQKNMFFWKMPRIAAETFSDGTSRLAMQALLLPVRQMASYEAKRIVNCGKLSPVPDRASSAG